MPGISENVNYELTAAEVLEEPRAVGVAGQWSRRYCALVSLAATS